MKADKIKEIKVDDLGRLCIFPEKERFTQIFTLAREVNWDNNHLFLYSPKPREWSYFQWYSHIINVIKECGVNLVLTEETTWTDIPAALKDQIITE